MSQSSSPARTASASTSSGSDDFSAPLPEKGRWSTSSSRWRPGRRVGLGRGGEALLPRTLLALSTRGSDETIVPHYLTERDYPWLRVALDEHARFVGRRRNDLRERMREPLPTRAPKAKLRYVATLLETLGCDHPTAPVPPREARWAVFPAAASRPFVREALLAKIASELGVEREELELALFADLKSERRVSALPDELTPARLAEEANSNMVRAWLRRAVRVRIAAWGNTRALVRQARLTGLICLARRTGQRRED